MRMGGFSWLARRPAAAGDPTHALFAAQSHSIVDNLVALFDHSRAWNCSAARTRQDQQLPSMALLNPERYMSPSLWQAKPAHGRPDVCYPYQCRPRPNNAVG